nr:13651_t:CDS:2 [Entrophospora candida]
MYSENLKMNHLTGYEIIDLLISLDELLLINNLVLTKVQNHLANEKSDWLIENFIYFLNNIFNISTFHELQIFFLNKIVWDPEIIFSSRDLGDLQDFILGSILEQDNLQIRELKVWNGLISWGFQQLKNKNSPPSPSSLPPLSKLDFLDHDINYNENSNDLDLNISNDNNSGIGDRRYEFEFKLLLRGSENGFTPKVFHDLCDNKGPNVVILKIRETGQIIGGYNPIGWRSLAKSRWQYTRESFLFSFGYEAIYDDPNFGPCFGKTDLDMRKQFNEPNNCSAKKTCYKNNITNNGKFSVEDYEVYQVLAHSK